MTTGDVFTIGGATVDLGAMDALPVGFSERFGTIPTLTLQRRAIALPGLPDPWVGKSVTWTHDGMLFFSGDVVGVVPSYHENVGWVLTYQCLGSRNRGDFFPHTDAGTGIDVSVYNAQPEDAINFNLARAGRTVGQILADVLTMPANAANLTAVGLGGLAYHAAMGTYTLPSSTAADLAALTVIPPRAVYVTGEKFLGALDGLLQQWAPNCRLWVAPDGTLRVLDLRTFPVHTFTMGTDPIEPTALARDAGDCFQRVVVRGQPIAIMALLKLSQGQLVEDFTWGSYTNAQAKANWTPAQFHAPGQALDSGTCACPSTTQVVVASSSGTTAWPANFWDQNTGLHGVISLSSTIVSDYTQFYTARIVSNTALTAGGTATLMLDTSLPHTDFDHYSITGLATGGSVVWTQYRIANPALWPRVTNQSTFPQPMINGGGGATLMSSPIGVIFRNDGGTFPLAFTSNPTTGNLRFIAPTYIIANNVPPNDVWVYIPINTNINISVAPPDAGTPPITPSYAGTSHTVEGLAKTLTVTIAEWRDPAQLSQMQAYASDLLESVKDTVVEGAIIHYGLFESALTFGLAAAVAGDDGVGPYPTGWDALALPIVGVEVDWVEGGGQDYITTIEVSNRRGHYSAEMFLRPGRRVGYSFGVAEGVDHPAGASPPGFGAAAPPAG